MDNKVCKDDERIEPEIGVMVHKKGEKFPATLIDISHGDISLISEKSLFPGTEVEITTDYNDNLTIHGTIKLVLLINKENRFQYRLGIEADQILASGGMLEHLIAGHPDKDRQTSLSQSNSSDITL